MRKFLGLVTLILLWSGCGPEWEMRKELDMQRIDPKQVDRLRHIHISPDYAATVSDRSTWQVHTALSNRAALADGDPATVASTADEHRQGEWIMIDLGCVCHFQNVIQAHPAQDTQPPSYRVDTADQRGFPFTLQYVGTGQPGQSTATFPRPVDARFIRITIIEDSSKTWAVAELEVN